MDDAPVVGDLVVVGVAHLDNPHGVAAPDKPRDDGGGLPEFARVGVHEEDGALDGAGGFLELFGQIGELRGAVAEAFPALDVHGIQENVAASARHEALR